MRVRAFPTCSWWQHSAHEAGAVIQAVRTATCYSFVAVAVVLIMLFTMWSWAGEVCVHDSAFRSLRLYCQLPHYHLTACCHFITAAFCPCRSCHLTVMDVDRRWRSPSNLILASLRATGLMA